MKKYGLLSLLLVLFSHSTWASEQRVLDIQTWQTDQGTTVHFVATPSIPVVDIKVAFAAGSARDVDQLGIANLTNYLLDQGAGELNANQIAEQLDATGALYGAEVNRDMAVVELRSLSDPKQLTPALELFTTMVSQPSFSKNVVHREKNRQIDSIQWQQQSPRRIASDAFYETLYQATPYAHSVSGTVESVTAITPLDIQQFYQTYYTAPNAVMAIVGDISLEQAKTIAEHISQALPSGKAAHELADVTPPTPQQQYITFPSTQTNIMLGQVGINHDSPDYIPLMVGNYTLGSGAFVSRLYNEVREKRGLAYSVYSTFIPLAAKGPFIINLSTKNRKADQALIVVHDTLTDFLENGPTEAELTAAKQYLMGNFPLQLESNDAIANTILRMAFYQLPEDYLDTYKTKVNATTTHDIIAAFNKHIDPNDMVTVLVGDREQSIS